MLQPLTKKTTTATISHVFEAQASMYVEPAEKTALAAEIGPFLKSRIIFQGSAVGTVTLVLPLMAASELAACLLRVEPDDPEAAESASNALGEMLNVLCGQLVSERFGTSDLFRISVPDVDTIADWRVPLSRKDAVACTIDGIPVLVLSEGLR